MAIKPNPVVGSIWRHNNGSLYTVLAIASFAGVALFEIPEMVVFVGQDGRHFAMITHDWHHSMTRIEP
jgi:hypothetical protein